MIVENYIPRHFFNKYMPSNIAETWDEKVSRIISKGYNAEEAFSKLYIKSTIAALLTSLCFLYYDVEPSYFKSFWCYYFLSWVNFFSKGKTYY